MKSDNKSPFCGSCPVISNLHIMEMCAHVNVSQTTVKLHAKCKQGDENKQQQHFIPKRGGGELLGRSTRTRNKILSSFPLHTICLAFLLAVFIMHSH